MAGVLSQQGKAAEAEQEARAGIRIAPGNAEAHRMLAKILSQRPGDEALSEMKRAVELARERADLRDETGNDAGAEKSVCRRGGLVRRGFAVAAKP